jgi:hypothetical protein
MGSLKLRQVSLAFLLFSGFTEFQFELLESLFLCNLSNEGLLLDPCQFELLCLLLELSMPCFAGFEFLFLFFAESGSGWFHFWSLLRLHKAPLLRVGFVYCFDFALDFMVPIG